MARPFILELLGNIGATRDSLQLRLESLEARYRRIVSAEGEDSPRATKLKRRIEQDRAIAARIEPRYQRVEARLRAARERSEAGAAGESGRADAEPPQPAAQRLAGPRPRQARQPGPSRKETQKHMQRMLSGILPGELRDQLRRAARGPGASAAGGADQVKSREPEPPPPEAQSEDPRPRPAKKATVGKTTKKKTSKKKPTKKK